MATSLVIKRMSRERPDLEKPNDDYMVLFKDDNLLKFQAYVVGTAETPYSFKFIKLEFQIPHDYPLNPPKVKFIQHSGGRVHPNLYREGKVCLSILGTWEGEPWALAMTCDSVLITIRSLLDDKPYTHEPHKSDNNDYNEYVRYGTWRWLLLDYLQHETEPEFKIFLHRQIAKHHESLIREFDYQASENSMITSFTSPYANQCVIPTYRVLGKELRDLIKAARLEVEKADKAIEDERFAAEVEKRIQEGDGAEETIDGVTDDSDVDSMFDE